MGGTFAAYSNTISSVSGTINYGAIDAGVNVLDAPSYKVGAFAGYFFLNQDMNGFGCHPLANINCIPNVPTTGSAIISENDKWQAMRVGVSGETQADQPPAAERGCRLSARRQLQRRRHPFLRQYRAGRQHQS